MVRWLTTQGRWFGNAFQIFEATDENDLEVAMVVLQRGTHIDRDIYMVISVQVCSMCSTKTLHHIIDVIVYYKIQTAKHQCIVLFQSLNESCESTEFPKVWAVMLLYTMYSQVISRQLRYMIIKEMSWRDTRAQPRSKSWGSESGKARIKGARERAGLGSGEGVWRAPPQKIFGILNFKSFNLVYSWKIYLEIIHFIAM